MNIFVFTHGLPALLPRVFIDTAETVCGVFHNNLRVNGKFKYMNTPQEPKGSMFIFHIHEFLGKLTLGFPFSVVTATVVTHRIGHAHVQTIAQPVIGH